MTETAEDVATFFPFGRPKVWDCVRDVDRLLTHVASRSPYVEYELHYDDDARVLRGRTHGDEPWADVPTNPSFLRAMIARVAKICSDETGEDFSPYFGSGTIRREGERGPRLLRCEWVNHLGEFRVSIRRLPSPHLNGHAA
jgi:hypothetical protein